MLQEGFAKFEVNKTEFLRCILENFEETGEVCEKESDGYFEITTNGDEIKIVLVE